jgi:hypothetical protein
MRNVILAAAAAAFLGLACGASPSIAAPASPAPIATPDNALTPVQMSERRMMRRDRRMMRRHMRHDRRMMRRHMRHERRMHRRMMRSM